jgi:hypothetical protein
MRCSRRLAWRDQALESPDKFLVAWSLSLPNSGCGGKFTLELLQFHQSIFFLDVIGSTTTLGAIPLFGFPVPSNVFMFHGWTGAAIGSISW